jgi:membrane protein
MPKKKERSKINYFFHKYFVIPFKILRISAIDTIRQDGVEHAGYLAFLSILSLFPFLIFLVAIIGFFGASDIGAIFVQEILTSIPKEISQALAPRINEIVSGPPQRFLTIAILGVIWTASSSVEGCRTILNRANRVNLPPPYIFRRLIAIVEFFVIIFCVIIGIIIFVFLPIVIEKLETNFNINLHQEYAFFILRNFAIFAILTFATSLLYYALPNSKQKFYQTIPGSLLVVILWFLLIKVFSFYLNNFHQINFVYGSLAGIIVSLVFFYLLALIFILGAEFNYHFNRVYNVLLKKRVKKYKKILFKK